jgi:alpha-L-fucosidase
MLVDIVSKGGNLLLNIGPKPDGTIQQEFVDRMLDIGAWLDTHGEAIYGTTASPFNLLPFHGRVTVKGSTLYVHIFEWPADRRIRLPNLKNEIRSVGVLGGAGSNLDAVRNGRDWVITLPEQPSDPVAGVLRVELDGTPDVEPYVIRPDASGNVHLPALFGHITGTHGQRIRYETEDGVVHVGNWIRTPDTISWTFELPRAGQYRLCLDHRVTPGQGGSEVEAFVNGAEKGTSFKVMSTRGRFAMRRVAALTLKKGTNTVMLKPASIRRNAVMDLREAVLKPI